MIVLQRFEGPWYPFSTAMLDHFRTARPRLICDSCRFEIVFTSSEAAELHAHGAKWKVEGSRHTCPVCLDRAILEKLGLEGLDRGDSRP